MITVYGRATSSNVQLVMWAIAELGLDHERLDYGHMHGGLDTAEFGAMNPHRLVPVIRDDGSEPIWEASAILRYLMTRYATPPMWPADPVARARVDMWAEWAKWTLCRSFTTPIFWGVVRTAPSKRDPAAIAAAAKVLAGHMEMAERQIAEHGFLAGPDFTAADIVLGHILYRYNTVEFDKPTLPALAAYYETLTRRPAYAEHVMVSYDSLRVTD